MNDSLRSTTGNRARKSSIAIVALWLLAATHAWSAPLSFEVQLGAGAAPQPITGRLFVFLSQRGNEEPRMGPNWFNPEPFFGLDVSNFAPGQSRRIDADADSFPVRLSQLPPGRYQVQAVLDHSFDHQHQGKAPGNFYSAVVLLELGPDAGVQRLVLDKVIPQTPFPESRWVQEVTLRSERLSTFHRREVAMRCAVVLPPSYYDQPQRRYPVVYIIPGFSGTHRDALRYREGVPPAGEGEVEFLRVVLDPNCKWGHHVFADSATNGPRGESLIAELIPQLDATYRTVAAPTARFLSGHSSGGWSSLWLQVTYPDLFGGVWSTSPDPVTFSDFQQVDLYADPPLSLYFDENDKPRPLARRGQTPIVWYQTFGKMDDCVGRGGQLRSFEAVFSPLNDAGLPQRLWHRQTGRIDPNVAKAWEKYDIRLVLERNWPELEPKLRGKLHVTTGSLDTFYLEGAVAILADSLKKLGSDADITILAGDDHSSLLTAELFGKMRRQMSAQFLKHHAVHASPQEH